ncbi:4Fe-4S binding protein [Geobacter sp. AOG2]|uniref:4Fe-4S binding protein n=1 Tax=Geobacter sp. AOG2 TaxID=1566347 RepID=UPI001CC785EC|nr:4Fe-4S binding protein [Geobacter sp. AOG2]
METARSGPVLDCSTSVPIHVDVERCSGCGRCVAACLLRLITLEQRGYRKAALITSIEHCTRCGACIESCPIGALTATPP